MGVFRHETTLQPNVCTPSTHHGGMGIASFILAIVGVCIGLAALTMSIINTVRIGRMKKRFTTRDDGGRPKPLVAALPPVKVSSAIAGAIEKDAAAAAPASIFHPTTEPPYYACIFTSRQNITDSDAIYIYDTLAHEMDELAKRQEGYLGIDSSGRCSKGFGITVSYWDTERAMKEWKNQMDHVTAQMLGKGRFYSDYHVHVAKVERGYGLKDRTSARIVS